MMNIIPTTLYEQCLIETSWLLTNCYWGPACKAFKRFSSRIIDDLIVYVSEISLSDPLKSSYFHLLLTSGRVTKFDLKPFNRNMHASGEQITQMLMDLSSACRDLVRVAIMLKLPGYFRLNITTPALNSLLSRAKNLEYVESDIPFDLRALWNVVQLKELRIQFELRNHIYDFLEVNGRMRINSTLTHLFINTCETPEESVYLEMHHILRYCTELIDVNINIAEALKFLHASQLNDGTLTQRYKIQCCKLGSDSSCATEIALRIASVTCPDMARLSVTVDAIKSMYTLKKFRNLEWLNICWFGVLRADYTSALRPVLETKFGRNLENVSLRNFFNVEFTSFGECCPNLDALALHGCSLQYNRNIIVPPSLPKLQRLYLNGPDDTIAETEQVVTLLYSAVNLKYLTLDCPLRLSDYLLEDILKRNSLSNLDSLTLRESDFSLDGIRMIASTMKLLQYFSLYVCELDEVSLLSIFNELNPIVQVSLG